MNIPATNVFDQSLSQYDNFAVASSKLSEAKQLMEQKRYEAAVDFAEEALRLATFSKATNMHFSVVKFYYAFADMLMMKFLLVEAELGNEVALINQKKGELFGVKPSSASASPKNLPSASPATLEIIKAAAAKAAPVSQDMEDEEMSNEEPEMVVEAKVEEKKKDYPITIIQDELQIAWESLETARLISEIELSSVPNESSKKVQVAEALGRIFMRMGDLLVMRGKAAEGILEYKKALEVRQGTAEGVSRDLAETYCLLGMAYMAIQKKDSALESFDNAKRIVESLLAKLLNTADAETEKLLDAFVDSSNQTAKKLQDILRVICQKVISCGVMHRSQHWAAYQLWTNSWCRWGLPQKSADPKFSPLQ
eukprot:TRINITY_DN2661_c0_g2_i4.p1 TRINITY_DN2661_c0_g2~~TRINITY_DN2661_c0_g2_i4.p1  ORF type:complete len:367 (-),score=93.68 TRINITY_DN2661_c0_g2_i4:232-1332(-)